MSTQQTEDEALARAGDDEPDDDELEDDEPLEDEPPAEPPATTSGPGSAKFDKEFEAEQRRHEKKVLELFGDDAAALGICVACGGVGFAPQPQPQTHESFKACPTCAGFGQVLTGSRTEEHASTNCPRCGGRGYLERQPDRQHPPTAPKAPAGEGDEWGTPSWMGDPSIAAG